jgi:hypothetical protein
MPVTRATARPRGGQVQGLRRPGVRASRLESTS